MVQGARRARLSLLLFVAIFCFQGELSMTWLARMIALTVPCGKSKERLTGELQAILDGGCTRVQVCSFMDVIDNPEASAVFHSFFGKQ
jgi:hypothetical protein